MWDQTDVCVKQYRCCIDYQLISFLSKSYQIVIDRAVDTSDHGKDVVDGFNAFQKGYLATCLRMRSTPKVDKIDSKRMRIDNIIKKGEVSFVEECKCLLELCDEFVNEGDKKYAKREDKSRLNHNYYWV